MRLDTRSYEAEFSVVSGVQNGLFRYPLENSHFPTFHEGRLRGSALHSLRFLPGCPDETNGCQAREDVKPRPDALGVIE